MTGTLDTDSSSSGDSQAMEGAGNGFLPDLPVLPPPAEWSLDQVPPEPNSKSTVLPLDSQLSQDSFHPQQEQMSPGLASMEKAVEQFQLANAQLFQAEQPPQPTEVAPQSPEVEAMAVPEQSTQQGQEIPVASAAVDQDGLQGKLLLFVHRF